MGKLVDVYIDDVATMDGRIEGFFIYADPDKLPLILATPGVTKADFNEDEKYYYVKWDKRYDLIGLKEDLLQILDPKNTVILFETPGNNHGCQGFELEIAVLKDGTGMVTGGRSCSSCWQVGHENGDPIISVGTIVCLPKDFTGTWQEASEPTGSSHNELVDDKDDPQPDCSVISPYALRGACLEKKVRGRKFGE